MYNKLLHRQIQKYLGRYENIPESFVPLIQVISNSYDHYEKDRKMIERSIELSSNEMIELNNNLTREKDELKKAHKELATLFESIEEVFYSVDMVTYQLIQMSPACEKVYGYTADEFFADGDLWQKVVHPEDRSVSEQQVQELYKGRQVFNQYRIIHKNNSIRWIENKVIPTFDKNDRLIRIDGITNDVTERKNAEKRLVESELRLKTIIDLVPHFIFAKDVNGKFILGNKAVADVYGSTIESIIGKSDADFNPNKEEVDYFIRQDQEVIQSGKEIHDKEETITDSAGNTRVLSTTKIPFKVAGSETPAVLGVSVDITVRKQAERELEKSVSLLEATIESTTDGILVVNFNGEIVLFNSKFLELWRIPNGIVADMNDEKTIVFVLDQLVNPEEFTVKIKELYEKKTDVSFDMLYFKDGRIFERYSKPQIINGICVGRVWSFRDVTERRKAEETLKRSETHLENKNKELELKNKELEQFAYVASHDLQEPLRTISNFSDLIQKKYKEKLGKKADEYFDYIMQSAERMRILIKDLLDYSRIGRQKEREQVDCNNILRDTRKDLAIAIKETGTEILSGSLPVVTGYPTEIKLLFQNLIANAIKFRKNDTCPRIEISATNNDGDWKFSFRDNGIGIERKYHEKIFIIFQRLHNRNEYEGSGIGLAHCKKIVELHGGRIWLQSDAGYGTTFYFTIRQ